MSARDVVVLSLVPLAAWTVATAAPPSIELYRRVVPLEATTGVISIRETVAATIDVPEKCDGDTSITHGGELDCRASRLFGRIWRIDFHSEIRRAAGDDLFVDGEPRGTIYLALAADRRDEDIFEAELRGTLSALGAAAFDEPFAGLHPAGEPFGTAVARRSVEPSWSCFEVDGRRRATRYSRTLAADEHGVERVAGTGSSTYDDEIADPLCSALEKMAGERSPEVLRTMSTPRVLVEEVLRVDVVDLLPERVHADELVPLPEGAWLRRRSVPGVDRSRGVSRRNEVVESRLAREEIEISARVLPAAFATAIVRESGWHSRWTLETVERVLGPLPEARQIDRWSLTATLLPTAPPRDAEDEVAFDRDAVYPVRLDPNELFTRVGENLDLRTRRSAADLVDVIVTEIHGLDSPGWMLFLCPPDGEATWGLAPTPGRARLLDADVFCGAIEARFP